LGDLWYVSQKQSGSGILPGTYEAVRQVLADPSLNFYAEAIIHATMEHFDRIPHKALPDPFDRFIVATAVQLRLPLVTADRAISATGAVDIIW
jgi:PIN domain nuclease of toxin-antitoxin system